MKKILVAFFFLSMYMVAVSFVQPPAFGIQGRNHCTGQIENGLLQCSGVPVPVLAGITVNPAPAPPAPYVHSVYFRYNTISGNYFKVESVDGCPFYTVVSGSPVSYTPVTYAESIFGIFFKRRQVVVRPG